MVSEIQFTPTLRQQALDMYETWKDDALVRSRQRRNVDGERAELTREEFWLKLVTALLTTQQRSGPGSPINCLLARNPFPLRLSKCEEQEYLEDYVRCVLLRASGIRRWKRIAEELSLNMMWLERGNNWERVMEWLGELEWLEELEDDHPAAQERKVARRLAANFWGLGPKQSRNVLQMLGLTKYETPLDSRIASWLNAADFPITVTTKLLARESSYCIVLDGVQKLCEEIDVYPCLFDSAVFASYDDGAWTDDNVDW